VLSMIVLLVCVVGVTLVRNGTTGRYLTAMRGSETAAAGIGINLTWQRILIFALSGVVAGIGGTILTIQQQSINPEQFNYQLSLAFVVVVVTTGVNSIEGAIQAGMGFVVIQQLLTYLPARYGGSGLTFVLFAFGALTYAAHPEGVLEFQKRRWTMRFERLIFRDRSSTQGPGSPGGTGEGATAGVRAPLSPAAVDGSYAGVATPEGGISS
jgi:ABC-type branched-subunit amino acid transport system permease subunit